MGSAFWIFIAVKCVLEMKRKLEQVRKSRLKDTKALVLENGCAFY